VIARGPVDFWVFADSLSRLHDARLTPSRYE